MASIRPKVGTLDATDDTSVVRLGNAFTGEIGSIIFQVTGTIGGSFAGIVRGTLMDPDVTPTWQTLGFVKMDAPDTVITSITAVGIYKVFAEGYTIVELKTNTEGTGTLPIYAHAVRG